MPTTTTSTTEPQSEVSSFVAMVATIAAISAVTVAALAAAMIIQGILNPGAAHQFGDALVLAMQFGMPF